MDQVEALTVILALPLNTSQQGRIRQDYLYNSTDLIHSALYKTEKCIRTTFKSTIKGKSKNHLK